MNDRGARAKHLRYGARVAAQGTGRVDGVRGVTFRSAKGCAAVLKAAASGGGGGTRHVYAAWREVTFILTRLALHLTRLSGESVFEFRACALGSETESGDSAKRRASRRTPRSAMRRTRTVMVVPLPAQDPGPARDPGPGPGPGKAQEGGYSHRYPLPCDRIRSSSCDPSFFFRSG